uniref:Uncharacterized protein n=1 Tax=Avena sativa TaxID=4498 RepID=A0ACD5Y5V5_AVESA
MTRDNLRARGIPKPLECEFCKEIESVHHLMFDCIVAKLLWADVFKIFNIQITDFESLASKWLCNKKFLHLNVVNATVLWGIWNTRNRLVFNRATWISFKQVWQLVLLYLKEWKVPFKELEGRGAGLFRDRLLLKLRRPLRLEAN